MKIMVFLHGTTIMHRNAAGKVREERVQQVIRREESIFDVAAYIPVGDAVAKLKAWHAQKAELFYLSSHRTQEDVEKDRIVLSRHHFPPGRLLFRQQEANYAEVAENVLPDILIEDNCESIGGESQMVNPQLNPNLRAGITCIVVPEFGGIDHLPDNILELKRWSNQT